MKQFRRLEVWTDKQCTGGVRLRASLRLNRKTDGLRAVYSVEGEESLTVQVGLGVAAVAGLVEGLVLRLAFKDASFEEWRIESIAMTLTEATIIAKPVLFDLHDTNNLYDVDETTGDPIFTFGMAGATAREVLEEALANPRAIAAGLPDWVTIGTIDCEQVLDDVTAESPSFLTIVNATQEGIRKTGRRAEREFVPTGTTGYTLHIRDQIGASGTTPTFRVGKNVVDMTKTGSRRDQATILIPRGVDIGAVSSGIGLSRWKITAIDALTNRVTVADPAGGKPPILADGQWVGQYLFREVSGKSYQIADSFAPDQFEMATLGALEVGDYVEFRATAPTAENALPYSYRYAQPATLPPSTDVLPIIDAEVTALDAGAKRITVRDGWGASATSFGVIVEPVSADGQHADRSARLSTLVATDVITSFVTAGSTATYGVVDVSAYQVGDWLRRAVDNTATHYGDINIRLTSSFSAAMTITAIDAVANTLTVESRDGGSSLHRTIHDTADNAELNEIRVYRPVDGLRLITACDGDTHTLDLDDVTGFSLAGGGGAVEILITSGEGARVVELVHPTRVQPPPVGYGRKVMTLTRDDLCGVANLCPNAVQREWTNAAAPPDGYVAIGGTFGSATIAQNTDALYTKLGGKSVKFTLSAVGQGIASPLIKWQAVRSPSPMSVRMRVLLTKWAGAQMMRMALGFKNTDGSLTFWTGQVPVRQEATLVPPDYPNAITAGTEKPAAGTFVDLVLNGLDITSAVPATPFTDTPASQSPAGAEGFVVGLQAISTNAGPIEGYIDGIMITPTAEAVSAEQLTEFGGANQLVQIGNQVLDEISSPLVEVAATVRDLARLNPTTFTRDQITLGAAARLIGTRLRYSDLPRMMQVEPDYLQPANTKITFATPRSQLTQQLVSGSSSGSSGSGGTTTGGTSSGPTPVGTPAISLSLSLDASFVPTALATPTGGTVTRVKFAVSTVRTPTADEVRAQPSITSAPFTKAFAALALNSTAYVGAIPYDGDTEGALVSDSITADVGEVIPPYMFWRRGIGRFQDDALSLPANTDDRLAAWIDSLGSGRNGVHTADMNTVDRPVVDGDSVRFGDRGGTPGTTYLAMPDISALGAATLLMSVKASVDPPSDAASEAKLYSAAVSDTLYPDTDGHIKDGWGSNVRHDLGDPTEDLTEWNALIVRASSTQGYAGQLNDNPPTTAASGTFTFAFPAFTVGFGGFVSSAIIGSGFTGNIRDVIVLDHWPSAGELAAWLPYLRGLTDTPPTESTSVVPHLEATRSGGDIIITAVAPLADSAKIAAAIDTAPTDAEVRDVIPTTTRPLSAVFAAPGDGETLKVRAFVYTGGAESTLLELDIPFADSTSATASSVFVPTRLLAGERFVVPANRQALYKLPIRIDGDFVVAGDLVEVT